MALTRGWEGKRTVRGKKVRGTQNIQGPQFPSTHYILSSFTGEVQ